MVNWRNKFFYLVLGLTCLVSFALFLPKISDACSDRFVTLVNPVRGRDLWSDKTLKPLLDQYDAISVRGMPAAWLLQYDALTDGELVNQIKSFSPNQEMGVLLEISRPLAEKAKVSYLETVRWSSPAIVFLSAYSPNERKLLIDEMMAVFKSDFGYYILLAYIIVRLPKRFRKVIVIILAVLTLGFVYNLTKLEPRLVSPILK
jgi:hypothetical protein